MTDGLDPGRPLGDRSRLAGRLAAPGRDALRRGPRRWPPPTRASRSRTGARSASGSTASTRSRRSRPRRARRSGPSHFEHDPSLRFEVVVEPAPPPAPGAFALELPNSGADTLSFSRVGRIAIPFAERRTDAVGVLDGGLRRRPLHPVPRRHERHRDLRAPAATSSMRAKSADLGGDPAAGTLIIDFNFAFQPSCAFDPRWACPLAPPENRLDIADPRRGATRLTTARARPRAGHRYQRAHP